MHDVRRRVRFIQNTVRVYVDHMTLQSKVFFIMLVVILLLGIMTSLFHTNKPNKFLKVVCKDSECQKAVSRIKTYINTKADPCEDFYSFACGRFHIRSHFVESPLDQMKSSVKRLMRNMVTAPMDEEDEYKLCRSARKQRKYYRLCTDLNRIDLDEDGFFIMAIETITKGIPIQSNRVENASWHEIIQRAFQGGTFHKYFLNVTTVYQQRNKKNVVKIEPVSSEYIAWLRPLWTKENLAKILAVIEKHWSYPFEDLDHKIDALVKFSSELFNASSPSMHEQPLRSWNRRMTTHLLDEETSTYFNANWTYFLQNLTGVRLSQYDIILSSFQDMSHFDNLMKTLSPANVQLWQTYIIINMIYDDCQYLSYTVRKVCHQIIDRAWPDYHPGTSRADFCYDEAIANFPSVAEREFIVKTVPREKRNKIQRLVTDVMETMFVTMSNKHHVFDNSKRVESFMTYASQLKVVVGWHDVAYNEAKFEHFYGFGESPMPNNIIEARHHLNRAKAARDFDSVLHPEQFHKMTELGPLRVSADAYYDPVTHSILLLAPMLTPPIYDEDIPEYLNYGSLGAIIGSLLINMVDETYLALRVNSYSDTADWMSKLVEDRSKDMKCVTQEYQKYEHEAPSTLTPKPFKTILPNVLSHYQGIVLAYKAYDLLEVGEKEEDLTEMLGYTRSQLFWIISTIYQCTDLKYEIDKNIVETYRPTSFQYAAVTGYKVNGPKMNSYEFAKDFNCPLNSRMNPTHKCAFGFYNKRYY